MITIYFPFEKYPKLQIKSYENCVILLCIFFPKYYTNFNRFNNFSHPNCILFFKQRHRTFLKHYQRGGLGAGIS